MIELKNVIANLISEIEEYLESVSYEKEYKIDYKIIDKYLERIGIAISEIERNYKGEVLVETILLQEKVISLLILKGENLPRNLSRLRFLLRYDYRKLRTIENMEFIRIQR